MSKEPTIMGVVKVIIDADNCKEADELYNELKKFCDKSLCKDNSEKPYHKIWIKDIDFVEDGE